MDISTLQPVGRKAWAQRKWDAYVASRNTMAIVRSEKTYYEPSAEEFICKLDRSKWHSTVDRKINYLLARPPVASGHQDVMNQLMPFIRESALEYTLRGSLIWIVQGDGRDVVPKPQIMNNTIAVYSDEYKESVLAYIRKYTELTIDDLSGEEKELNFLELYYEAGVGWRRDTYNYALAYADKEETLAEAPLFIQLGKTGDASLYSHIEGLLGAFERILNHQDTTVTKNTKPLTEVRGYTGTSDADLEYALDEVSIVKVDGAGGITIHSRAMDSASIDGWKKCLMQEYYEATATVGKEMELVYAQSGKAMDRLFVDMENSAKQLAEVLETALKIYFASIGYPDVDIVWNTDRPVDDVQIISGIQASNGLLSQKTLLEQHPWVDDVDEELRRIEEESLTGMEDLGDDDTVDVEDEDFV